jgi:hypothetical protein
MDFWGEELTTKHTKNTKENRKLTCEIFVFFRVIMDPFLRAVCKSF